MFLTFGAAKAPGVAIKSIAPATTNDLLKKARLMKALRRSFGKQASGISEDSLKITAKDKIIEMNRSFFSEDFRFCPWHT